MRNSLALLVLLIVVGASGSTGVFAQEATPTPVTFPVTPDPALCRVAPRPIADFTRFLGASGTPGVDDATPAASDSSTFVPPQGEPADPATTAAVAATAVEIFACFNAGDWLRATALWSDAFLAQVFHESPPTEEDIAYFAATPVPRSPDEADQVLALREVVVLPDGRVGAFVDLQLFPEGPQTQYGILVREDDRYLLDDVPYVSSPEGTPTP
jgi:hypothetical protein